MKHNEDERMVTEYVIDIIYLAMKRFNINYTDIDDIFTRLGYWDKFNDTDIAMIGVHYGVDEVLDNIKEIM